MSPTEVERYLELKARPLDEFDNLETTELHRLSVRYFAAQMDEKAYGHKVRRESAFWRWCKSLFAGPRSVGGPPPPPIEA